MILLSLGLLSMNLKLSVTTYSNIKYAAVKKKLEDGEINQG